MTTNAEILAKADEIVALVRTKLWDELTAPYDPGSISTFPGQMPIAPIIQDYEAVEAIVDLVASGIRPEFVWFTEPDPTRITAMLDSLAFVAGNFESPLEDPAIGYIDQVGVNVSDWYGSAADAFNINFLTPLPSIRHNQVAFVAELAKILEGYQTMLTESRRKIIEIADAVIVALNALPTTTSHLVMFSVASAVVGVFATVISGGTLLTISLAVIGGGFGVAADGGFEASVGGGNVNAVLTSMTDAIALLKQDMANAESLIVQLLDFDANLLSEAEGRAARRELNDFIPLRPNVIDALSGADVDFELSTGQ